MTPKVYELDATLSQRKFQDINKNKANCQETSEKRSVGRTFTIPNIIQNNVTIETSKPMIFKEHVGGSSDFPNTKIGETLIKQKAIDFLANDFPDSFSKLNKKLAMCLSIKGSKTDTPTTSPPSSPKTQSKNTSVKTPMETKLQQTTLTDSTEYEGRSIEEKEEDENYKNILGKLTRIKSRVTRNPQSDIAQSTIQYLRDLQIIQPEDTEKLNIITKIDGAIVQLQNHFDTTHTEIVDV